MSSTASRQRGLVLVGMVLAMLCLAPLAAASSLQPPPGTGPAPAETFFASSSPFSHLPTFVSVAVGVARGRPGAGGTGARAPKSHDRERFDVVGEGHATGGVQASFADAAFPGRALVVKIPRGHILSATGVRVTEDGRSISGVVVQPQDGGSSYQVQYFSNAPLGEREIELNLTVYGVGSVDLDYNAPASISSPSATVLSRNSFWHSGRGLRLMALLAALLITIALLILFGPRRHRKALLERVGEFTGAPEPTPAEVSTVQGQPRLPGLERVLERMSWWPRFKEDVDIANFSRSAVELAAIGASGSLVFAVLVGALTGVSALSIILLPLGPLAVHLVVRHRVEQQRDQFREQLAGLLEELGSTMRGGHGLVSGLAAMVESASEPSRREWSRVLADERLGKPLEDGMRALAARMRSDDIEQVALVATLHRRTGGNMAEVLDRIAEGVRERTDLRRELKALTSQASLSRWVVTAIPPALFLVINAIDPRYMRPLYHTRTGLVMLGLAVVMLVTGSLIMRKMTEIEV